MFSREKFVNLSGCVGCFSFNFVEHETFRFEFHILATVASLCNIQKVYTAYIISTQQDSLFCIRTWKVLLLFYTKAFFPSIFVAQLVRISSAVSL